MPDANKVLSKVTVNAIPTETKSQQPNLSSGDQTINATSGKFMTSFTITKDTINHIASNIRSGKTLYGVTGNLQPAKAEETKTVTPNFSSGNEVVTPTSGKVLSQVTIQKDTTNHKAENIKKDITLYGVTGTLESGGGEETGLPTNHVITVGSGNYTSSLLIVYRIEVSPSYFNDYATFIINATNDTNQKLKIRFVANGYWDWGSIEYSFSNDGGSTWGTTSYINDAFSSDFQYYSLSIVFRANSISQSFSINYSDAYRVLSANGISPYYGYHVDIGASETKEVLKYLYIHGSLEGEE